MEHFRLTLYASTASPTSSSLMVHWCSLRGRNKMAATAERKGTRGEEGEVVVGRVRTDTGTLISTITPLRGELKCRRTWQMLFHRNKKLEH